VLSDWQTLVMCLDDDVSGCLPKVQVADLATLLAACVQVAACADRQSAKQVDEKSDRKGKGKCGEEEATGVKQEPTVALMDTLPGLLKGYATEPLVVRFSISSHFSSGTHQSGVLAVASTCTWAVHLSRRTLRCPSRWPSSDQPQGPSVHLLQWTCSTDDRPLPHGLFTTPFHPTTNAGRRASQPCAAPRHCPLLCTAPRAPL
jgi:hypothetical protein